MDHRLATLEDVAFLADVVLAATRDQSRLADDFDEAEWRFGFEEWTAAQVRGEVPGSTTYVLEVDGERVGRLRLVDEDEDDSWFQLAGLQLLPAWQGRGLGTSLVRELQARGRMLQLGVEKDNPRARVFWERLGFRQYAESDDEHLMLWSTGGGWIAFRPIPGMTTREEEETPQPPRFLTLEADEDAGPWRADHGGMGWSYEHVGELLGITRELFDDVMAWNAHGDRENAPHTPENRRAHWEREQELLRRLATAVRPGIEVEEARDEMPVEVPLTRINVLDDRLVLWSPEAVESGDPVALPEVAPELVVAISLWLTDLPVHDDPPDDESWWAWSDQGDLLAGHLQGALGRGYVVRAL